MRRLVGIRPTGKLHLGHYFSVIKPALEFDCDVLIAKYHAPHNYSEYDYDIELALRSFGVKKERIKEHKVNPAIFFSLLKSSPIGLLGDMTQYKSAKKTDAHLLIYPVLMAQDVIGYDEIYVGEDQVQHLEFARKILRKSGYETPKTVVCGKKVMDLKNPKNKMSKSNPVSCLFLSDTPGS